MHLKNVTLIVFEVLKYSYSSNNVQPACIRRVFCIWKLLTILLQTSCCFFPVLILFMYGVYIVFMCLSSIRSSIRAPEKPCKSGCSAMQSSAQRCLSFLLPESWRVCLHVIFHRMALKKGTLQAPETFLTYVTLCAHNKSLNQILGGLVVLYSAWLLF